MKEIILKISDFAVRLELDEEIMALPNNYRPFVAESAEDVGELLSMKVGLDAVSKEGSEMLSSFEALGYRQDVYKRQEGGYIFEIYSYDGYLVAAMQARLCRENFFAKDSFVISFVSLCFVPLASF